MRARDTHERLRHRHALEKPFRDVLEHPVQDRPAVLPHSQQLDRPDAAVSVLEQLVVPRLDLGRRVRTNGVSGSGGERRALVLGHRLGDLRDSMRDLSACMSEGEESE